MKDNLYIGLFILAGIVMIGITVWVQMGLWTECRDIHSWLYCAKVLSR